MSSGVQGAWVVANGVRTPNQPPRFPFGEAESYDGACNCWVFLLLDFLAVAWGVSAAFGWHHLRAFMGWAFWLLLLGSLLWIIVATVVSMRPER